MLPYLGIEMSARGTDSWGASDGYTIIKHIGSIVDSFECPPEWSGHRGIFHTRSASHGSPKLLDNAHPFEFPKADGGRVIGIHNGIIRTHTDLNTRWNRKFEVDSMHIYANFAEGKGVEGLEGYGALAWYEEDQLNFCRFGTQDLHVATLEGGELVFCSTYTPLSKIARILGNPIKTNWQIDEFVKYQLTTQDGRDTLLKIETLPFEASKKKVTLYPDYSNSGEVGSYPPWNSTSSRPVGTGYWMSTDICYICRTTKVDTKKELVCPACLELQWQEFLDSLKMETSEGVN